MIWTLKRAHRLQEFSVSRPACRRDTSCKSPTILIRMKHRTLAISRAVSIGTCAAASLIIPVSSTAKEVAVARYSTFKSVPTDVQQDPLAAPVTTKMPVAVTRISEAVDALLAPSGYRLAPANTASADRATLLALSLPEVHRDLSGLSLRSALQTLVGPVFILVEDPVHRLVSFERCQYPGGGR